MFTSVCFTEPANITDFPQSTHASLGGTASFMCGARGVGQPRVHWSRLNQFEQSLTISSDERFLITVLESNTSTGTVTTRYMGGTYILLE